MQHSGQKGDQLEKKSLNVGFLKWIISDHQIYQFCLADEDSVMVVKCQLIVNTTLLQPSSFQHSERRAEVYTFV